MSTAEQRARNETGMMLAEPDPFTLEEVNRGLDMAEADAREGRVHTCDDVHSELEKMFPWLCE